MTSTGRPDGAPEIKPARHDLFARLVHGIVGIERLAVVIERLDESDEPITASEWRSAAWIAVDFGLVTLAGAGDDPTVARTDFGDRWAATLTTPSQSGIDRNRWPLQGPGRFDVSFYPLTKRPAFPVFALAGPGVVSIRQGGWNLVQGFGRAEPNPVSEVEMLSVLSDGSTVSVQSANRPAALPGLRLEDGRDFPSTQGQLTTAMKKRAAPWMLRPLKVDNTQGDALVLDLHSTNLPDGVLGPALVSVAHLDGTTVTIIGTNPDISLTLASIDADDLLGPVVRT